MLQLGTSVHGNESKFVSYRLEGNISNKNFQAIYGEHIMRIGNNKNIQMNNFFLLTVMETRQKLENNIHNDLRQ